MKTIELLNKAVELGFSREKALADIDASLDEIIGAENRKPIEKEELNSELSDKIFWSFFLRGAEKTWNGKDVPVEKEFDLIGGNQI